VVLGGLVSAAQNRLGALLGYAALADTGAALIALSLNNRLGLTLLLLSLVLRPCGLILMAAGVSGLRGDGPDDALEALRGAGLRAPWSMAALIAGGLSMAGLPVSAGFVGRWALYRALAPAGSQGSALVLLLAQAGVMVGVARAASALLARPNPREAVIPTRTSEGWLTALIIAVAIAAVVAIGLFPQLVAPLASRLAEGYPAFAP